MKEFALSLFVFAMKAYWKAALLALAMLGFVILVTAYVFIGRHDEAGVGTPLSRWRPFRTKG